jgi:hypothetical protein
MGYGMLIRKALWGALASYRRMLRITTRVLFAPAAFAKTLSLGAEDSLTKAATYWLQALNYLVRSGIYTIIGVVAVIGFFRPGKVKQVGLDTLAMELLACLAYAVPLLVVSLLWYWALSRRAKDRLTPRVFTHCLLYTTGAGTIAVIVPVFVSVVVFYFLFDGAAAETPSLRAFAMTSQIACMAVSFWAANSTGVILSDRLGISKKEVVASFLGSLIAVTILLSVTLNIVRTFVLG